MSSVPKFVADEEKKRLRAAFQRLKTTKGVTQVSIAQACGWKTASTFNRLLSGQATLTYDSLMKVAAALEIDPEFISPRLMKDGAVEPIEQAYLPVSHVRSVSKGVWTQPFATELRVPYQSDDSGAYALIFDYTVAPTVFSTWVVVVEPSGIASQGDRVVVRLDSSRYTVGEVLMRKPSGALSLRFENLPDGLYAPEKCALVTALVRRTLLRDFRSVAGSNRRTRTLSSLALGQRSV